jgi:hypothetical protein
MQVVDRTRETLLTELATHTSSAYPDVVVVPGHPIFWHPDLPAGSLADAIEAYLSVDLISTGTVNRSAHEALRALRVRIAKGGNPRFLGRPLGLTIDEAGSRHAIGTDGSLPDALPGMSMPPGAEDLLDRALDKAALEFEAAANTWGFMTDERLLGNLVGFSTWCYRRCPATITQRLIEVHAQRSPLNINPVLLVEGLGRSLKATSDAGSFFDQLEVRLRAGAELRKSEYAALSRLLGGLAPSAERLSSNLAHACLAEARGLIDEENRARQTDAYKNKFKSALLMLSALLRHRRRHSDFAYPNSREGEALLNSLHKAAKRIETFAERAEIEAARHPDARRSAARLRRLFAIVQELEYFVRLEGRDPNIIRKIEDLSDA